MAVVGHVCVNVQLSLAGKGTSLGLRETWNAVVGGKMGHRVLLVGVAPRVRSLLSCCFIRPAHVSARMILRSGACCL